MANKQIMLSFICGIASIVPIAIFLKQNNFKINYNYHFFDYYLVLILPFAVMIYAFNQKRVNFYNFKKITMKNIGTDFLMPIIEETILTIIPLMIIIQYEKIILFIILKSILFSTLHVGKKLGMNNFLNLFSLAFLAGLVFGFIKNPLLPIFIHIFWNVMQTINEEQNEKFTTNC